MSQMLDLNNGTIYSLLNAWHEHRKEGKKRGFEHRHEWEVAPDWAHQEAGEWLRLDSGYRAIVGARLAEDAINAFEEGSI